MLLDCSEFIVGIFLAESVEVSFRAERRPHKDFVEDTDPQCQKAVKCYENLAKQLVNQADVPDLFACALDQVCFKSGPRSMDAKRGRVLAWLPVYFKLVFFLGLSDKADCFNVRVNSLQLTKSFREMFILRPTLFLRTCT